MEAESLSRRRADPCGKRAVRLHRLHGPGDGTLEGQDSPLADSLCRCCLLLAEAKVRAVHSYAVQNDRQLSGQYHRPGHVALRAVRPPPYRFRPEKPFIRVSINRASRHCYRRCSPVAACKFACNIDPLKGLFASNSDPLLMCCVSVLPFGLDGPGRSDGDDWRGHDRRDTSRLF